MSDALTPGVIVTLKPGIRRLVAPNPGMMTGPGTNSYLLGSSQIAVIDPGPAINVHIDRIVTEAGAPIRWILVTHTHPDHSPGVARLAAATGAQVIGMAAPEGDHQDRTFRPTRVPRDGEIFETREFALEILHTPGHASNHLCFLHLGRHWLFSGDHIINGSTVVIDPPDGDMTDYLASLRRLRELSIKNIAGGHGAPIDAPSEAIDALIDHRLAREAKVIDRLGERPASTLSMLVRQVYDEIDPALHAVAERSLLAHLIKLERDGAVIEADGRWTLA